jgi:peptidoglycan/LPS O-acetylase OafA/YrhL
LPNYILILAFNVLLYYILYHLVIDDIGYFIVFLQNFATPHPDFFTEAWSLSVEEYAYIIGPLILYILLLFRKNNLKEKLYIVMVFIII